jgi:hypothetical protein
MKDLLLTLLHLSVVTAKLCGPGGVRAVIAENLLVKQQLIVLRRARQRAPNLTLSARLLCGFESLFLSPGRIRKLAIGVRPSTLLAFHQALVRRKYQRLFSSSQCPKKPGPKGPSEALIQAIVELKSRNPRFGCPRIARIISHTFVVDIDKNVVGRVLAKHYRPGPVGTGPSWLSFIGLWLLKSPFLLRQLMLQPTMDTLLGDDVGAFRAPPDPPHMGAFARRAPARGAGLAALTARAAALTATAVAARAGGPLALGRALGCADGMANDARDCQA